MISSKTIRCFTLLLFLCGFVTNALANINGSDMSGDCESHHRAGQTNDADSDDNPTTDTQSNCCALAMCSTCPPAAATVSAELFRQFINDMVLPLGDATVRQDPGAPPLRPPR